MKARTIITTLFFLAFSVVVSAQSNKTPGVTARQKTQKHRIKEGVKEGDLTRRETAQLGTQQASIRRSKRKAKADGSVTKKERAHIHRRQNRASRNIAKKKHN